MTEENKNYEIAGTIEHGPITITMLKVQTVKGPRYKASFKKIFMKDGEEKTSYSYFEDELEAHAQAIADAKNWMAMNPLGQEQAA